MKNELCFKINGLDLYKEIVLLEMDYPLLYTCSDGLNRYIVLCIDGDDSLQYLVAKTNADNLLKMIKAEISIRKCFKNCDVVYLVTPSDCLENDKTEALNASDIPDENLPDDSVLFNIFNDDVEVYCRKLKCESMHEEKASGVYKSINTKYYYHTKDESLYISLHYDQNCTAEECANKVYSQTLMAHYSYDTPKTTDSNESISANIENSVYCYA